MKKDSAPGPDGIPYGAKTCARGLGPQFLFNAYRSLLGAGTVPEHIAESRTVFIPKTISVEKLHHQIRLRILSCSRMSENHREPEVPEAGVPAVECLDGLARITLEELATTHFVKNGTLQNACSTSPRVVAGLVKSALMHIARLMNSRQKGLKKMMAKVQWLW